MATAPTTTAARADAAQLLYERYYANVYRYALSQLRSPQDAEDAAQNTFLRAFAALQKGVRPENEVAWLFKIAHNVCASSKLAWLRRRRVESPRDLELLPVQPATPESRRDELTGLEDALASMPPRLREAFLLREWQGLSYAEIAERLDTSRSAVETLIFRARKHLAQSLEQPARRVREALGVAPLLSFLRGLLDATPAVVKAAGAVAVLAGAGVAVQPLVTPKHSPPTPASTLLPVAPAIAQPGPATAPAAAKPTRKQQPAGRAGARTSPAGTTGAATPLVPLAPGAPPLDRAETPPAAASPATPSSTPPASTPRTTPASTTQTPAGTTPLVPPLETPSLPSVTTPALPVPTPALPPVTTPALPPVTTPAVPPPTLPLATPAVPTVSVPDLPKVPNVPTVTVPGPLP